MKLLEMIANLKQERAGLDEAILTLERLAVNSGEGKRPGRPPAWMRQATNANATKKPESAVSAPSPTTNVKTGRTFTRAQRTEQAKRMKSYWRAKRKAAKQAVAAA